MSIQGLERLQESASQTAGPYVHIGLIPSQAGFDIFENCFDGNLVEKADGGSPVKISGYVYDGMGCLVRDAVIEIWQADAGGQYFDPDSDTGSSFRGWGRTGTHFDTGEFVFQTIKPGRVVEANGRKTAPHIMLWIVARGINIGLNTRLYFDDEAQANAVDPVLNMIEWKDRLPTLLARRTGEDENGVTEYRFDIHLQGEKETIFFDI